MKTELIYALLAVVWALVSFTLWSKRKDKDLLWLVWIGVIGFVAELASYLFGYVFPSPSAFAAINLFLRFFGPVALLVLIWIGYRMLKGSRKE